jgi:hypothetical protein
VVVLGSIVVSGTASHAAATDDTAVAVASASLGAERQLAWVTGSKLYLQRLDTDGTAYVAYLDRGNGYVRRLTAGSVPTGSPTQVFSAPK